MKIRVFLAAFAVALVPLATFIGWGLLQQEDDYNNDWAYIDARNGSVYGAWSNLDDEPDVKMMASLDSMRKRLTDGDQQALVAHTLALMDASDDAYEIRQAQLEELTGERPVFHPADLKQLRKQGFVWGEATYWSETGDAFADVGISVVADETPVVAWMPDEENVWLVHVVPAVLSAPSRVPWSWVATVIVVMLVIVAGFAAIATLLATRGVAKPLRAMAHESEGLTSGAAADPVPEKGPSEVKRAARAFNAMAARLGAAQETEQQFLLSVSHELKTPLTSLKGYGEALTEGAVTAEEAGPVVSEEAGRMQRLVQDLLDLGRAKASRFGVRRETVDLTAIVREAVRRHAPRAESFRVELGTEVTEDSPPVLALADSDRVLQVVSNLVENAIRCAPAFSQVTVWLPGSEASTGRDEVVIRVSDSGLGLEGDELEHAFDRFYLYERYGRERPVGTGLGLAIVKDLTEAMKGRVSVHSAPGMGTAFTVALPRSVGGGEPAGAGERAAADPIRAT